MSVSKYYYFESLNMNAMSRYYKNILLKVIVENKEI